MCIVVKISQAIGSFARIMDALVSRHGANTDVDVVLASPLILYGYNITATCFEPEQGSAISAFYDVSCSTPCAVKRRIRATFLFMHSLLNHL